MIFARLIRCFGTKPEVFEFASNKPLPQFGGFSAEGFNAALADGSVRFIAKGIDGCLNDSI